MKGDGRSTKGAVFHFVSNNMDKGSKRKVFGEGCAITEVRSSAVKRCSPLYAEVRSLRVKRCSPLQNRHYECCNGKMVTICHDEKKPPCFATRRL